MKFAFNIIGWQTKAPGLSETEQWHKWSWLPHTVDPTMPLAKPHELPVVTARRLSSGSRLAVDCDLAMLHRHDINTALYTSRHGGLEHNYRVLHALATEQALSPTDLAPSVHNSAVGNLTIAAKKSIVSPSLSAGRDTFQQGSCEVIGLLQAGYQRVLMTDFDGLLLEFHHPQLPPNMPTWPFAVALVIESGDNWQCETRPYSAQDETTLSQSLLFLQHYLQGARAFTLPSECVQWQWSQWRTR